MALTTVQELQTLIQQKIRQKMPQSNLLNQPENTEKIAIVQSVGRVLAQDVISPLNVPNANVSAMDGYALPQAAAAGSRWKVGGISAAGHAFEGSLHSENECVRIMTGAVVPRGMRTVVLQENVELLEENDEQYIVLKQNAEERSNIRYAGEEITQGAIVLHRGRILREADVLFGDDFTNLPCDVIVKKHIVAGKSIDTLYRKDGSVQNFETPLADPLVIIGAGCTFSSSLACLLARGESLESAIQQSKEYIYNAIITGIDTNLGVRKLLNHGVKF